MSSNIIDASIVCKLLKYDPQSGKLFWLYRPEHFFSRNRTFLQFNTCFAGKEAFTATDARGYKSGRIFDKTYHAHRVAWAVHYGEWPNVVDHINGDRADNRLCNIRNVTKAINAKHKLKNNEVAGVNFCNRRNAWRARIVVNYKDIHLGYFSDKQQAITARENANKAYGFSYYERNEHD